MTVPSSLRHCRIFSAAVLLAAGVNLAPPTAAFAAYHIGTFMVPVNDIPEALHVGDGNGDGVPDIIVADQGSQDLTILACAGVP